MGEGGQFHVDVPKNVILSSSHDAKKLASFCLSISSLDLIKSANFCNINE